MIRSEWLATLKNGDVVRFVDNASGEWVTGPLSEICRVDESTTMGVSFATAAGFPVVVDSRYPERHWFQQMKLGMLIPAPNRGPIQPLDRVFE